MQLIQADSTHLNLVGPLFDAYRIFYRKESDVESVNKFIQARLTQKDSVIYLAINAEGNGIGFTQLYPSFSSTKMKRMWILNDLFVDPNYRGQGISKLLITKAKELSQETKACGLLLETEKHNMIGNKLYPSVGFELEENNFYFWSI